MRKLFGLATIVMLSGCASTRVTLPSRSATEQLLISEAADAAALAIKLKLPDGSKAFLETTNLEGADSRYAVSAIRQSLLEQGNALMEKREDADIVVEVRAGALSIDTVSRHIGIPAIELPSFFIPALTALNRTSYSGIAKFSLFAYSRVTGKLVAVVAPVTGYSHRSGNSKIDVVAWSR